MTALQKSYLCTESSKTIGETTLQNHKSFTVLVNPRLAEAETIIKEAIQQHRMLLIVGQCSIHYVGRASSKLDSGERVLMIKEDGSLLVHRSVGHEPVNWQPSGCVFHTNTRDHNLEIHAVRQKPAESVKAYFDKLYLVSCFGLVDSGQFSLYASEEDMHKAILLRPSLIEEKFKPISYEKKVEPGFMDVYGIDKEGKLVVVEVKRKTAGKEAVFQLAKYIDAVRSKADRKVRGILAAPQMAKDVQKTLAMLGLEFKCLDPKKCAEIVKKAETRKLVEYFNENAH